MEENLLFDKSIKDRISSDNLVIPEDLNTKIIETLNNLPERRKGNHKAFRKLSAAAAIFMVITCISMVFPAYARNVPVVDSVFQFLSDKNIIYKDYIQYSSDLNISKTSNDVTVTINSIAYDGIDLSVSYTVESKAQLGRNPHILHKDFKINGRIVSFGSGGGGDFINKNTYVGVDNFHVAKDYLPKEIRKSIVGGNVSIPDAFTMDLNIREFSDGTKGEWDFKFKVSKDKIQGKVSSIKTVIDLSDIKPNLKANEVIFTPLNTVLRIVEDNTNSIEMINYYVFDDKGRCLQRKGASGNGSADINRCYWQYTFRNLYENSEEVTFIPVMHPKEYWEDIKNNKQSSGADVKEVPLNFTGATILSEGNFGDYIINKVEFQEDKTLIYYECSKYVSAEAYGLAIKDEAGNLYHLRNDIVKELDSNKFVAEIEPLSKDKKYIVQAPDLEKLYNLREDMKFKIKVEGAK